MKLFYFILACLSLVLGIIGAVLPLLPTTPLILLAAYAFAKSSPKLEAKLKASRIYRYYAADFAEKGAIPRHRKKRILAHIYVLMTISIILVGKWPLRLFLLALTAWITWYLFKKIPDQ